MCLCQEGMAIYVSTVHMGGGRWSGCRVTFDPESVSHSGPEVLIIIPPGGSTKGFKMLIIKIFGACGARVGATVFIYVKKHVNMKGDKYGP